MRRLLACCLLVASSAASAQEGFPLDGTWRGERKAEAGSPAATLVMVLEWNGSQVTGVVNPGPKSLSITEGRVDPEGWKVSLVAQSKTGQKATFEGTLDEIGSYHRHVTGTWTEGGRSYNVRIVRE
ncbi:MAG: hypothetical protein ABW136_06220 [Steroidobacteraceae bacterium]